LLQQQQQQQQVPGEALEGTPSNGQAATPMLYGLAPTSAPGASSTELTWQQQQQQQLWLAQQAWQQQQLQQLLGLQQAAAAAAAGVSSGEWLEWSRVQGALHSKCMQCTGNARGALACLAHACGIISCT
jgi:hypothetical protein